MTFTKASRRRAVAIVIGSAVTFWDIAAFAQPIDPYAESATRAYVLEETHFRAFAREVYFAQACKVFLDQTGAQILVLQQGTILFNEAVQDRIAAPQGPALMREAAQRGAALAAKPGGCTWWHTRLDEVHRLREMANAAESIR